MDFIPYGRQSINRQDILALTEALQDNYLTTGPKIDEFEKALAKHLNFQYVVALSNGTAALHLASLCLLEKNETVVTPPNSFLATANSILYAGAQPLFIDITDNGLIDLNLAEDAIKRGTKALYAVSFSGLPFDGINYLKEKYNIKFLLDNAHFIGQNETDCDIATYSFHPVKHITTGEGGAVATNDKVIYEKLRTLRNHGMQKSNKYPWDYEMTDLGYNYRLTDIQCALGLSQLSKLDLFQKRRHQIAKRYHQSPLTALYPYNNKSSYHLFVARHPFESLEQKAEFFIKMREKNIGLQYHYIPINKQPYYRSLGYGNEKTPIMDRYYLESFSLPIYPSLKENEQEYVIETALELLP